MPNIRTLLTRLEEQNAEFSLSELGVLLDHADTAYHRIGLTPIMSDECYDKLKQQLKTLDPTNQRLFRVGCPYSISALRDKVEHNIPMGSLDNTDDGFAGYAPWLESMCLKLDQSQLDIMASLKVDGSSIRASYVDGALTQVATRGNGDVGEDITCNAVCFNNLPTFLPDKVTIDVRGEAILFKKNFEFICNRDSIAKEDQSNPRNVGNGILARDNGQDAALIDFIAFNVVGLDCSTEAEKFQKLQKLGFQPVPHRLCRSFTEFQEFYNVVVAGRDGMPFEIDGIVVALNDVGHQTKFITKDKKTVMRPKFARAVKFPHKSNTTKIAGVELTVGHTRAIIPTAILDTVRVGGVNVSNALLNNWDEIERLGIAIGDEVEVILAGDIIPKIIRLVRAADLSVRKPIIEPNHCPKCGEATTREYRNKRGAILYCSNTTCPAAMIEKVNHWIGSSKKGVGILGIGDAILKAMWDTALVSDPADLYKLTVDDLKNLLIGDKMCVGESRAQTIIDNIAKKRSLPLETFLGSLGIDLLGKRRAKVIIDASEGKLVTLDQWLDPQLSQLEFSGFNGVIKEAIVTGIEENRSLIAKLIANGVVVGEVIPAVQADTAEDKPFSGLSFCLTGTRQFSDDIVRLGGVLKSGVSKQLSVLVQADPLSTSTKTQKADALGIKIISLDYLEKAIKGQVDLRATIKGI